MVAGRRTRALATRPSRQAFAALCAFVATTTLGATPIHAATPDCNGTDSLDHDLQFEAGTVAKRDGKLFFFKNNSDSKGCPADTAACRRKAFLLPGNALVLSVRTNGFVCATYVNDKGVDTSGWLPADAVETATRSPLGARDWAGNWTQIESTITIKPSQHDALSITGDATWGAQDPDRVARGGVNIGNIVGTATPTDGKLAFTMGDDATLPVNKGDEYSCRVWMQRVGPYLVVDDNNNCGGHNVTFRGVYLRNGGRAAAPAQR